MLRSFLVLGLKLDATDREIRQQYLSLVKKHSPERSPDQFSEITRAYELIKDKRSRVKAKIFTGLKTMDVNHTLDAMAAACRFEKKQAGLSELLNAVQGK